MAALLINGICDVALHLQITCMPTVHQSIHPSFTQLINDSFADAFEAWGISFPDNNFLYLCCSEGVPLCPGQNLAGEERRKVCGWLLTPPTHIREVLRDTLPGTAAACETGFRQGPVLPPGDMLGWREEEGWRQGGKGLQRWWCWLWFSTHWSCSGLLCCHLGSIAKCRAVTACSEHPPHLCLYSLNLPKGTRYLSMRTFPWTPPHFQRPSFQAASSEECIQCFHTTRFPPGLKISIGFMPLCKSEFYLQAHNFAWSPPEAKSCSQRASGMSMSICRSSEWGSGSAQRGWWKAWDWKMRSFLFYSLGHKELFI